MPRLFLTHHTRLPLLAYPLAKGSRVGTPDNAQPARCKDLDKPNPWGAGGVNRATKHSVTTQVRTERLTLWMSWYHLASSYAVGQREALTKPRMRQASGLPSRQRKALIPWVGKSIKITS